MIPKLLSVSLVLCALGAGTCGYSAAPPPIPPLVSPSGKHNPGRFVWGDLFSTDPAASSEFYRKLFGWKETVYPGEKAYRIMSSPDGPIAGIGTGPKRPDGKPAARWIPYISIKDIKRAVADAVEAGGHAIVPPFEVPDRGTHAIVADPEEALFGMIWSAKGDPDDFLAEPNEWMWITLFARDSSKVLPFYRIVAGWHETPDTRTERPDDYVWSASGVARAGLNPLPPEAKADPAWVGFVRVTDLAATVAQARALGAKILVEPRTAQVGNETAIISDPFGAIFGVAEFVGDSK